ncbi:mevalonate kinase [Trypanosoma rangeli]|uniref:Mevalonate kinase n=1 Tax=Trypanosoma rangeli TaxID=5698 RepID=A0A3R7M8L1_TRYRA|nr:mevalonate kinase [Trypanosoma rangeli]RNF11030.1 mevalonate kinase [Trypanosoma rangeli]|eukprot:RNF11030.1 mevalonate kinase [Trypanosoma rangeli]
MRRAVVERTEQEHIGFGKVILFGEHFVVYGAEALVAGIQEYTSCRLELTRGRPGVSVVDKRPAVPGYIVEKAEEQRLAHGLVFRHLNIDTTVDGVRIHLGGSLVPSSGIGASASDVVSLSRALSEMYGLGLSEQEVNHSAFVGEGGYHGTPSGVDNTAATFGGLISYRRDHGKAAFSRVSFLKPLFLVVCSTGITASTTKVVGGVRKLKEEKPAWFTALLEHYNACVGEAKAAIETGNLVRLGELMNRNHALCQELTVSCDELDAIVNFCRENGALGAKMSGTGRGGLAVALAADAAQSDSIADAVRQRCPAAKFVWKYSVFPKESSL